MKRFAPVAALCLSFGALADSPPTRSPLAQASTTQPDAMQKTVQAGDASPTDADSVMLMKLHHGNQMEIQMGALAKSQASDKRVKDYGEKMVKDHTALDKDVTKFATKTKKIALPDMPPDAVVPKADMDKEMASMDKLKGLNGPAFDREYMAAMNADHAKDISEVTTAREATTDKKLKKLLDHGLSVMQDHKKIVEKWEAKAPEAKVP